MELGSSVAQLTRRLHPNSRAHLAHASRPNEAAAAALAVFIALPPVGPAAFKCTAAILLLVFTLLGAMNLKPDTTSRPHPPRRTM